MSTRKRSRIDAYFETNLKTEVFEFKWTISEFEKLFASKTMITSKEFTSNRNPQFCWYFSLKLHDDEEEIDSPSSTEKHISVHVNCNEYNSSFLKMNLDLCILNNEGKQCHTMSYKSDSPAKTKKFGFEKFISWENLIHTDNIFFPNNTLNLHLKITLTHFESSLENLNSSCVKEKRAKIQTINDRSTFSIMYQNPDFCDLTIVCDDVRILVHKTILAAKSEVLYRKIKKLDGNELKLPLPLSIGQELICFMYTGNCPNLHQYVEELYEASIKLKILDLRNLIEKTLNDTLTVENVSSRLIWADKHKAGNLKANVIDFINRNIQQIICRDEFQTMINNYPNLTKELFNATVKSFTTDVPEI